MISSGLLVYFHWKVWNLHYNALSYFLLEKKIETGFLLNC